MRTVVMALMIGCVQGQRFRMLPYRLWLATCGSGTCITTGPYIFNSYSIPLDPANITSTAVYRCPDPRSSQGGWCEPELTFMFNSTGYPTSQLLLPGCHCTHLYCMRFECSDAPGFHFSYSVFDNNYNISFEPRTTTTYTTTSSTTSLSSTTSSTSTTGTETTRTTFTTRDVHTETVGIQQIVPETTQAILMSTGSEKSASRDVTISVLVVAWVVSVGMCMLYVCRKRQHSKKMPVVLFDTATIPDIPNPCTHRLEQADDGTYEMPEDVMYDIPLGDDPYDVLPGAMHHYLEPVVRGMDQAVYSLALKCSDDTIRCSSF
jgi:hypothetical protein